MDLALPPAVTDTAFGQAVPAALARKAAAPMRDEQAMRATAQEFEAVFIGQMTEAMFAGLKTEAPFGGGHAEGMWRSQLSQEIGRSISAAGGIGIADAVLRSMIAQQEAALTVVTPPAARPATAADTE